MPKKIFSKRAIIISGLLIIIFITSVVLTFISKDSALDIAKKQVSFVVLVPSSSVITIDQESTKYDTNLNLLSYNVIVNDTRVIISEQPTPESFNDIPQVYDKILAGMNEYAKFDTGIGMVHLTRPNNLGGKQAAIINTKGTLFFAKPEKDFTEDQWRSIFKSIDILK